MDVRLDMELDQFRTQISEALANGGTQSLIRLTDEELAVLDPEETLIPKPHLAAMDAQQREWAMATALRSLVARETIEIHNIEELAATLHGAPETAVDMRIRVDVDLALTLRRTADRALAVNSTAPPAPPTPTSTSTPRTCSSSSASRPAACTCSPWPTTCRTQ